MFTFEKVKEIFNDKHIYNLVKVSDGTHFSVVSEAFVSNCLERIKNFEVYEDDVWIISYPKCGTTWTQEMSWLICNDLNFEAASENLDNRSPFLEFSGLTNNFKEDSIKRCAELRRPRQIKTHLPIFLLPDKLWSVRPKIVYVTRNPKDAVISNYHHFKSILDFNQTLDDMINFFLENLLPFCPMNESVLEFWKIRNESNVLFLFYEDMKRDLESVVRRVMKFFNKEYSDEQIEKLCDHLSFDSMKKNAAVNKVEEAKKIYEAAGLSMFDPEKFSFIRKGIVGSYKIELTEEQNKKLDDYMNYPEFQKYGFAYKLE